MAGQHWGERGGEPSKLETVTIGVLGTVAAILIYGSSLLALVRLFP
jgi:hypothetical protein